MLLRVLVCMRTNESSIVAKCSKCQLIIVVRPECRVV